MNETETPRTFLIRRNYAEYENGRYKATIIDVFIHAEQLERELAEAIKQRDRLAEALRKLVGDALFCSHADTATTVLPPQQVDDDVDALTMP